MAFTNPNLITSGVSKEEFENLKKIVNEIALDVSKLKQGNVIEDKENIISSEEQVNKTGYKVISKNIRVAKLVGAPRIDNFNFKKLNKEEMKLEEIIEEPVINVNTKSNVNILDNASNNVVDTIVDLSELININKPYIINKRELPNIVKTNSGHRTITMTEGKANNIKNSYYDSLVKIA